MDYIKVIADKYKRTKEELLTDIKVWYNGYSWDGETLVYNPFSTINFFNDKVFNSYWFATGTPTFLIDILKKRGLNDYVLEPQIVMGTTLNKGYDVEKLEAMPLLFQTGYLTIKDMQIPFNEPVYTLAVPNKEVSQALMNELLNVYFDNMNIDSTRYQLEMRLRNADEAGLKNVIESIVAQIPYYIAKDKEAVFHIAMLMWLKSVGFNVLPEVANDRGRCDIVIAERNFTAVAELKFSEEKSVETLLNEAMAQIDEKKYYNQYLGRILKLAIAFTGKEAGVRLMEMDR